MSQEWKDSVQEPKPDVAYLEELYRRDGHNYLDIGQLFAIVLARLNRIEEKLESWANTK